MKFFYFYFISIILFMIIFCFMGIIPFLNSPTILNSISFDTNYYFSSSEFFWPLPGYHTITSYFGNRISPTTGASSNHSGIDIAASEGTSIFSVLSGKVVFTGFYGANGHSIIIQSDNNFSIQYSHISPNYIINSGDIIQRGTHIGFVGPKYIEDVIDNPYKDSTGKTTNGATTGPHLHLTIKQNNIPINPLIFFK